MPFTDHLEPEDTETTSLLASQVRHGSRTRRKKLEIVARMLGRVFNPMNDAAIGGIVLGTIQNFYTVSEENTNSRLFSPYVLISVLGLVSTSSLMFEIIHSYQLDKHSRFLLGDSYYEHTKVLIQELTATLGSEVVRSHHHFERWIMELKQSSNEAPIKNLLRDYEVVNRYNHFRKMIDTLSALILGITMLSPPIELLYDFRGYLIFFACISIPMGVIFLIKMSFDRIEHNWLHYENNWKKLSLFRRKNLLAFRTCIEALYHLILAMGVFYWILFLLEMSNSCLILSGIWPYLTVIPFAITYMLIQLIPEHRCCKGSNAHLHLKRGTQGIFQGGKITAFLSTLVGLISSIIIQSLEIDIYYFVLPIISGVITAINTIINYQEPNPTMMSTVDHKVSKLREEIVVIKENLLEEAGHEKHGAVNAAMHDKSEIGPDPQDPSLENTHRSTDRSLLSAFCCFWGRSNNNEDTTRTHASGRLPETATFQKV